MTACKTDKNGRESLVQRGLEVEAGYHRGTRFDISAEAWRELVSAIDMMKSFRAIDPIANNRNY